MDNNVFRKKSIDKVTSPEQLNDYVRVSNPGVWMVLAAIIVLLAGVCVWGMLARLETKLDTAAVSKDGQTVLIVKEGDITSVEENMTVIIGDKEYKVTDIAKAPITATTDMNEYTLHLSGVVVGEWIYLVMVDAELEEGTYEASIIIETITPMEFIFN